MIFINASGHSQSMCQWDNSAKMTNRKREISLLKYISLTINMLNLLKIHFYSIQFVSVETFLRAQQSLLNYVCAKNQKNTMKKLHLSLMLLVGLQLSANLFAQTPCKEIVGYYPNWQWYDRSKLVNPSSIAYSKYSIINYCFFKPEASGLISNTDTWADENLLQGQINWSTTPTSYYPNTSIIDLAHTAGTKVMVSIGGWTLSDNFPSIAADASKRAVFAGECNRLLSFYNFDGIDIDWEYPGYAAHSGTVSDKANFTIFMQQIRDSISALGLRNGKTYKLSACFGASAANANNIDWNAIVPILDMLNLMTYDFFGAWDCLANHNSPLYAPSSGDPSFNINSAFNMLVSTYGVPSTKINIGVGFYGRSQTGATALHAATSCGVNNTTFSADDGSPLYYNVVNNLSLFDTYWDNIAKVPYLMGKAAGSAAGTFVSYDNSLSIGYKAQYIVDNNARGAIIWEITGDYMETTAGSGIVGSTPLVDTLNQVFCSTTTGISAAKENEEILIYPNPASNQLYVQLNKGSVSTLRISDIKGALLLEQNVKGTETSVDISSLAKGIYFLQISNSSATYNQKIIKE